MSLRPLPGCLDAIVVPECFSVTAVAACGGCRLRAVLGSSRSNSYRLPSGPEAAIGTLVHRVKEKWADRTDATVSPDDVFDAEYAALVRELELDADRRHFADLSATLSPSQWSMVRRQVVAQCSALSPLGTASSTRSPSPEKPRLGAEVDLEARSLRIRGRADRIDKDGSGGWVVRDYKTGSVLRPDGTPRPDYTLQMQCYGLMITEHSPSSEVRLILDDGDEYQVPFDHEVRDSTREFLRTLTAGMPAAGAVGDAADLATPGAACTTCAFRVACRAYRREAPAWWAEYPRDVERIPSDTWGIVRGVTGGAQTSLILDDDAGRKVRVDGLDQRHGLVDARTGDRVWAFALNAAGPARGFDGRQFHPRNFFELPRDRRERRAWGVVTFAEPSG